MFPKVLYFDMACEKPVPPVYLPPPCFSFFTPHKDSNLKTREWTVCTRALVDGHTKAIPIITQCEHCGWQ